MGFRVHTDDARLVLPAGGTTDIVIPSPVAGVTHALVSLQIATLAGVGNAIQIEVFKKKGSVDIFLMYKAIYRGVGTSLTLAAKERVYLTGINESLQLKVVTNPGPTDVSWACAWAVID